MSMVWIRILVVYPAPTQALGSILSTLTTSGSRITRVLSLSTCRNLRAAGSPPGVGVFTINALPSFHLNSPTSTIRTTSVGTYSSIQEGLR